MRRPKRQRSSRPESKTPPGKLPAANLTLPPKEVLDALPEYVRRSVVEAASFAGPIPPPTMYGAYEDVLPGSADRILAMAESEQRHRIEWETDALHASMRDTKSGQRFGFAALTVCIGAAVFLAMCEPIGNYLTRNLSRRGLLESLIRLGFTAAAAKAVSIADEIVSGWREGESVINYPGDAVAAGAA